MKTLQSLPIIRYLFLKNYELGSKKGKIITVAILATITLASFVFWFIPQENESAFVVSDYENYLDGIKNIHQILDEEIDTSFQNLKDGKITPEEYIRNAEITSEQITQQISELVKSKPSEKWQESYINYMDALKKFNSQIRETIVYANTIGQENDEKLESIQSKIQSLEKKSEELVNLSNSNRP